MKKIAFLLVCAFVFSGCNWFKKKETNNIFVDTSSPTFTASTLSSSSPSPNISKNNDQKVIENLFALINNGQISEAVLSLHSSMIADETTKQTWGVNFNTIKNINLISFAEASNVDWTDDMHIYKALINVNLKPDSQYMGWEEGENIRWVSIKKEDGSWKVSEFATGQ